MVGRRIGSGMLACVGLVFGCAEPEPGGTPVMREPGRILVEPAAGARLCAGTERWVDDEIGRVQETTGLPPAFDLLVTLGGTAVAERCTNPDDPETVLGCTVGEGATTEVVTGPSALSHELVHALRRHYELGTRAVFEEGFAEVINGSDAHPRFIELDGGEQAQSRQPETMVQLGPAEFREAERYRSATHFLDFVVDEHGIEALGAFMRGGVDGSADVALTRFESHFGRSLADQAQRWRDAGRHGAGRGVLCPAGAEPLPDDAAVLRATVDCDRSETMGLAGAGEVAWVRQCVQVPGARYQVELTAGTGAVDWEPVPGTCAEGSEGFEISPKRIEPGPAASLPFAACTWAVTFRSTVEVPEDFELRMSPE